MRSPGNELVDEVPVRLQDGHCQRRLVMPRDDGVDVRQGGSLGERLRVLDTAAAVVGVHDRDALGGERLFVPQGHERVHPHGAPRGDKRRQKRHKHKQQRHLMQPAFHKQQVALYRDDMVMFTQRLLDSWQEQGLTQTNVKVRLFRARKKLASMLDETERGGTGREVRGRVAVYRTNPAGGTDAEKVQREPKRRENEST